MIVADFLRLTMTLADSTPGVATPGAENGFCPECPDRLGRGSVPPLFVAAELQNID